MLEATQTDSPGQMANLTDEPLLCQIPRPLASDDLALDGLYGREVDSAEGYSDWQFECAAIHSSLYRAGKRALDIVGAVVGMIVFSPIILVAMLAVYLKDGGPVLFRQSRVGLNGETFMLIKIRTMVCDAEKRFSEVAALNRHSDQRTFKMDNDPRIIPLLGTFFRKSSIDEFPQLWNVLRGEMSLVGPRPALPREVEKYSAGDMVRLAAKPGLTCFWQVAGRGNLCFREQIELDRRYVRECSMLLDIKLILLTLPALMFGKGAH